MENASNSPTHKKDTLDMRAKLFLLIAIAMVPVCFAKQNPVVAIWPEGTAKVDASIPEKVEPRKFELVKNIHNPNLTVFRPAEPNGAAVVICPGGGYSVIASGLEGFPVAEMLNQSGITAFVLKYRLPTTKGADFKHPVPLSDALRAIQWVRYHAADYKIDPKRIGIMGFSAGGHLAASAGTLYSKYQFGTDAISKVDDRPDFLSLGYPVISTKKGVAHGCVRSPLKAGASAEQASEMSAETNVTAQTPPTFLFHAKDDKGVVAANSELMHQALKDNNVPTELKLYAKGGHGFGLGRKGTDSTKWSADFIHWLTLRKVIPVQKEFFTPKQDKDGINAESVQDSSLPNVLIIGDSISIGYTKPVIELMKGKANVQRAKANCGDTNRGKSALKKWLGQQQWDVIHFNWGLHDLCYRSPESKVQGNRDKKNGQQAVSLAEYEQNLEGILQVLKATGAKLIWASTTVVPEGEAGRVIGDDVKYNAVAAKLMKKYGVVTNDLHALSMSFSGKHSRPGDVHFSKEGSALLAKQVANTITAELPVAEK